MSIDVSSVAYGRRLSTLAINAERVSFGAKVTDKKAETADKNPISRTGETMNLFKATFLAGMALGARLLFELFDGDFVFETAGKKAKKIIGDANKNKSASKQLLIWGGGTLGLILAGISAFALLYTAANAPKIAYNSKVNTFKKSREMDVYIQANKAEKAIYDEMNQKAITADEDEKQNLKANYEKMQLAKNRVPDFVKL